MADRGLPQLQNLKGNPSSTKNTGAREDERRADMDVRQNQQPLIATSGKKRAQEETDEPVPLEKPVPNPQAAVAAHFQKLVADLQAELAKTKAELAQSQKLLDRLHSRVPEPLSGGDTDNLAPKIYHMPSAQTSSALASSLTRKLLHKSKVPRIPSKQPWIDPQDMLLQELPQDIEERIVKVLAGLKPYRKMYKACGYAYSTSEGTATLLHKLLVLGIKSLWCSETLMLDTNVALAFAVNKSSSNSHMLIVKELTTEKLPLLPGCAIQGIELEEGKPSCVVTMKDSRQLRLTPDGTKWTVSDIAEDGIAGMLAEDSLTTTDLAEAVKKLDFLYRKAVLKKENAAEYKELGCSWALCQARADGYIGFRLDALAQRVTTSAGLAQLPFFMWEEKTMTTHDNPEAQASRYASICALGLSSFAGVQNAHAFASAVRGPFVKIMRVHHAQSGDFRISLRAKEFNLLKGSHWLALARFYYRLFDAASMLLKPNPLADDSYLPGDTDDYETAVPEDTQQEVMIEQFEKESLEEKQENKDKKQKKKKRKVEKKEKDPPPPPEDPDDQGGGNFHGEKTVKSQSIQRGGGGSGGGTKHRSQRGATQKAPTKSKTAVLQLVNDENMPLACNGTSAVTRMVSAHEITPNFRGHNSVSLIKTNNQLHALKIISRLELDVLTHLQRHPRVVPLLSHRCLDTEQDLFEITMPYLRAFPRWCLTRTRRREVFRSLFQGLEYIHSRGVIHRDIAPPNLFLDSDGSVVIADFGSACFVSNWEEENFESHRGYYLTGVKTPALDMWAAGVIFFEQLFGLDMSAQVNTRTFALSILKYLANAPRVGQAKWDLYPEYELLIALLQPDYVRIISASAALSMKFFKDDDASWVHGFPSDDLLI